MAARRAKGGAAPTLEGIRVGAVIMVGTLLGLIALIFALVLRYDPEARGPKNKKAH